jgi:hypothetical protein
MQPATSSTAKFVPVHLTIKETSYYNKYMKHYIAVSPRSFIAFIYCTFIHTCTIIYIRQRLRKATFDKEINVVLPFSNFLDFPGLQKHTCTVYYSRYSRYSGIPGHFCIPDLYLTIWSSPLLSFTRAGSDIAVLLQGRIK